MPVTVRPAAAEDAETIAAWLNAGWARAYLSANLRDGTMSPALVRAALRRRDQRWFVAEQDGAPAGLVVFDGIDEADGIANVWYLLGDAAARGRGTMPAALDALLASNPLGLHVATAWIGAPNTASARCLEKAGFRRIGEITGAFNVGGRHNRVLFERVLAPPGRA